MRFDFLTYNFHMRNICRKLKNSNTKNLTQVTVNIKQLSLY